ncbi:hypothetical protein [Morganella morganii]|uniref:hypothetical protein n=1 Tax=Morganella morganii TaxID=582 RepID=UPI000BD26D30|nr:hypothetical protein [Morganella morganii]MBT0306443.1 hypothetical protein [Morganella morganii subsp. morganii]PCO27016.1 hypothetical protein CP987_15575 [Morganella morganii]HDT1126775.1 hypothetical protein [Morganella morganii subsp. morganii]
MFVKNSGRLVECTVVCTAANGIAWLLLWGRLLFTQLFRYAAVTASIKLRLVVFSPQAAVVSSVHHKQRGNFMSELNALDLAKNYLSRTDEPLTPIEYLSKLLDLEGEFKALLKEKDDFSVLDDETFIHLHNGRFGHLSPPEL